MTVTINASTSSGLAITSDTSGQIAFQKDGTTNAFIDSSGNFFVTRASGLGYGTGAGGMVTQATSKATAVTLNTPTGQIVMNGAALAAGATVYFILNNSLLNATDILLVQPAGGSVGTEYQVWSSYVQAGSAYIAVKNNSAGSLSQVISIYFAIIKTATA